MATLNDISNDYISSIQPKYASTNIEEEMFSLRRRIDEVVNSLDVNINSNVPVEKIRNGNRFYFDIPLSSLTDSAISGDPSAIGGIGTGGTGGTGDDTSQGNCYYTARYTCDGTSWSKSSEATYCLGTAYEEGWTVFSETELGYVVKGPSCSDDSNCSTFSSSTPKPTDSQVPYMCGDSETEEDNTSSELSTIQEIDDCEAGDQFCTGGTCVSTTAQTFGSLSYNECLTNYNSLLSGINNICTNAGYTSSCGWKDVSPCQYNGVQYGYSLTPCCCDIYSSESSSSSEGVSTLYIDFNNIYISGKGCYTCYETRHGIKTVTNPFNSRATVNFSGSCDDGLFLTCSGYTGYTYASPTGCEGVAPCGTGCGNKTFEVEANETIYAELIDNYGVVIYAHATFIFTAI